MIYLDLLWGFLKVGLFSFGGAYGAIPLIRDVVLSYGWLSDAELSNMIAISESTPGPIMINLATYVGSSQAGLIGSAIATSAVVIPAFAIILLIMIAMKNAVRNKYVQAVLGGLKPCIIGIILATGLFIAVNNFVDFGSVNTVHITELILTAVLGAVMFLSKPIFKQKISPILLIVISAVLGIAVYGTV